METIQSPVRTDDAYRMVFADILSHSITGELIGMQNFAMLVGVVDDIHEKMEAAEHADNERGHAEAFWEAARKLGVDVVVDVNAPYWKRIRDAFVKWAGRKDTVACFIIQEVMLESFAVSLYNDVAAVAHEELSELYRQISAEEQEHLEHAIDILKQEYQRNPAELLDKTRQIHEDVMTVLGEMVARRDLSGHCGICHGDCIKETMHHVQLDITVMRGRALNCYLRALDEIGLPGEETLTWVASLPA